MADGSASKCLEGIEGEAFREFDVIGRPMKGLTMVEPGAGDAIANGIEPIPEPPEKLEDRRELLLHLLNLARRMQRVAPAISSSLRNRSE